MNRLLSCVAFAILLLAGCRKDVATTDNNLTGITAVESRAKAGAKPSAALTARLKEIQAKLPAGYEQRLERNAALVANTHQEYRDMVNRVLAVTPTPCDANTPLNAWLNQQIADWDATVISLALITGMLDFPLYDALLFENSSAGQYFGVKGEYTQVMNKTFKDLRRFWNINSSNMVLGAMHGSMLRDRERVIRIDMILYGDSRPVAEFWADLILELLATVPQYRNGDHPIFTFNAFATGGFSFPPYGEIPRKIIMGDGIMEAYTAIGYGDVAPQAILAHEYGHQVQFALNLFGLPSAEATRRTELMADAYSAYYLSHARGATMQWKRVRQFLQVFFNIGDCQFSSPNHHGTPTQRMAAADWAYNVANNAQKQGHILTSQQFAAQFDTQLPVLVTK